MRVSAQSYIFLFAILLAISSVWSDSSAGEFNDTKFCAEPNPDKSAEECELCKLEDEYWANITATKNISFHTRSFTGECGPNCRPSCLTLMLDLDKLDYERDLSCSADSLCQCQFEKCSKCEKQKSNALFQKHPTCYLENADCLGATVYDDIVAYIEQTVNGTLAPMQHCASVPDGDLYCRFQDWPIVRPMEMMCEGEPCFAEDRKIFFEYCNVVEEDPYCDRCEGHDAECSWNCPKVVQPFPPGWTTFVVSASIPYPIKTNAECDQMLTYENQTGTVCFLERIDLYYPLPNKTCGDNCPNCHDCPLLNLGDRFGPLEVVGFGHAIKKPCTACDQTNYIDECEQKTALSCSDMLQCEELTDCTTEESLGLASFQENACSFCPDTASVATERPAMP